MNLINSMIHQAPTHYGFVVAFLVIALLVRKEMHRALRPQALQHRTEETAAPLRDKRQMGNGLIGFLLALYGLILCVRLLSFFP